MGADLPLLEDSSAIEQAQYGGTRARRHGTYGRRGRAARHGGVASAQLGGTTCTGELSDLAVELLERARILNSFMCTGAAAELLESNCRTANAMEQLKRAVAMEEFEQPRLRRTRLAARSLKPR